MNQADEVLDVYEMIDKYKKIRARLRNPPNAVPDTGINLRPEPKIDPPPTPPKPTPPSLKPDLPPAPKIFRPGLTFSSTLEITANEFGISGKEIRSKTRLKAIALPRQVAVYIAATKHGRSLSWIGRYLDMDHTTILYARNKIKGLLSSDPDFKDRVECLENKIAIFAAASIPANSEPHLETQSKGDVSITPIPQVD